MRYLVGANSLSSSDNTVTPGTENDVVVLGTTVGIDLLTSSNETVVYSGSFGDDTIVYFAATGNGIDLLAQIAASPVFIGAELLQTVLDLAGE